MAGLALPLAGCVSPLDGVHFTAPDDEDAPVARATLHRAKMVRGAVVIEGPRGYCIDKQTLTSGGVSGGFALLASCESLTGRRADVPVDPVLMTVTVLPYSPKAAQPRAHELARALAPHRALEQLNGDGLTIVQLAGGAEATSFEMDPKHWRGAMVVNGHMIGLALYAPKGSAMSGAAGQAQLIALAETLREASPLTPPKGAGGFARRIAPKDSRALARATAQNTERKTEQKTEQTAQQTAARLASRPAVWLGSPSPAQPAIRPVARPAAPASTRAADQAPPAEAPKGAAKPKLGWLAKLVSR